MLKTLLLKVMIYLLDGQGVKQNSAKAIALTWMAFQQRSISVYSDRLCTIYSEEKYGLQDIIKAHMWCSLSVKIEGDPLYKAYYEDKRIKLAAKLKSAQLNQSIFLLKKCESSENYRHCETPLNIE